MTDGTGPRRPSVATRFRKGLSGNPRGRPRSGPRVPPSAFDIVIDRTRTVTQSGRPREVAVEEALQHKTYQDALAGSRAAMREVLRWIGKRERWFAAKASKHRSPELRLDLSDPDNANRALSLLGIAEPDSRFPSGEGDGRLLLRPWAVQAALSRCRRQLSARDVAEIEQCTRDAGTLRWPAGARYEPDE